MKKNKASAGLPTGHGWWSERVLYSQKKGRGILEIKKRDSMLETLQLRSIWSELKRAGATEEEKEEQVPAGFRTEIFKEIKLKDLIFEVRQDQDYDYSWDESKEDEGVFLVNYHKDFWIERNEIITKEETAELYRGEINWEKTEREKGYWIFELSCLVHSGVWLKLGYNGFMGDPGGWDTSHMGLVLVSKNEARTRKKAEKLAEDLIDYYNKLLSGEVYQITVKQNEKEIDSISGIVGEVEVYQFIKDYKVSEVKDLEVKDLAVCPV